MHNIHGLKIITQPIMPFRLLLGEIAALGDDSISYYFDSMSKESYGITYGTSVGR